MKTVNNLLITGLALIISLSASVQAVAMEQNQRVNPHLSQQEIQIMRNRIAQYTSQMESYNNPKNPKYDPAYAQYYKSLLQREKDVLYGVGMYKGQKINPHLLSLQIEHIQMQLEDFKADPKSPQGKDEERKRKCLEVLLYGNRTVTAREILQCVE